MPRLTSLTAAIVCSLLAGGFAPGQSQAQGLEPAAGGKPPAADPQAPRAPAVPTGVCTPDQQGQIAEAFDLARQRLGAAISLVSTDPNNAHVRRWFGTADRKLVMRNLQLTLAAMQDTTRLKLRCNADNDCGRGTFANARPSIRVITLCSVFFRAGLSGQDNRYGILVHEVSHVAARTRDVAYQPQRAAALAKDDPNSAAMNADNFEYFVEFLPQ
jgi:hypothetical protein